MAEPDIDKSGMEVFEAGKKGEVDLNVGVALGDIAVIPSGTIDPVYEAKARILNRAVRILPAL